MSLAPDKRDSGKERLDKILPVCHREEICHKDANSVHSCTMDPKEFTNPSGSLPVPLLCMYGISIG